MHKRWVLKTQGDPEQRASLARELNINAVLASLLLQRGVTTFDQARDFFRPSLSMLHDPFLMKDMDKAVERIEKAIAQKEKILVYGDYDVDGTTAVSLVYLFLKAYCPNIEYYIPDRYSEGYGISFQSIEWAKAQGISLVIALDCGIKANEKIAYARTHQIDFIICDHHRPGNELPEAVAVLDPKRDDCSYSYDELPGCAIGFKLIQAFALGRNIPLEKLVPLLDLVAIAIAADIVPITGENRVLTYFGLKQINQRNRPGIKAIIDISKFSRELTVSDIVFTIAPRINAAGRMESGKKAVDLLISDCPDMAKLKSAIIDTSNTSRKELDRSTTDHAIHLISQFETFSSRKSTVIYHPDWHKGVIGIVASRLIDKHFYRPTIILTKSNGHVAGSARSVKDFDIYNAIEKCSDLLDQFGGHMYAAGLTLKEENVNAFTEKFEEVVASTIEEKSLVPEIEIDAEIELADITPAFYNIVKQFAPFGPGNMSPVFRTNNIAPGNQVRIVGNNHLKIRIHDENSKRSFDAIGFQLGDFFTANRHKQPFDICYHIEENEFNGNVSLQLNLKDIRPSIHV